MYHMHIHMNGYKKVGGKMFCCTEVMDGWSNVLCMCETKKYAKFRPTEKYRTESCGGEEMSVTGLRLKGLQNFGAKSFFPDSFSNILPNVTM